MHHAFFYFRVVMSIVTRKLISGLAAHIQSIMVLMSQSAPTDIACNSVTKCLNTGIILFFLLTGHKPTARCDNSRVNMANAADRWLTRQRFARFSRCMLRDTRCHQLFYVIMTDGDFKCPKNKYFPGHILVIEKLPHRKGFVVMQTFVNEYDIRDARACRYFEFQVIQQFIESLRDLYATETPVWTQQVQIMFSFITGTEMAFTQCSPKTNFDFQFKHISKQSVSDVLNHTVLQWQRMIERNPNQNTWTCDDSIKLDRDSLLKSIDMIGARVRSLLPI